MNTTTTTNNTANNNNTTTTTPSPAPAANSNPAKESDEDPVEPAVKSSPEKSETATVSGGVEEEVAVKVDDPMEEDSVNPATVFCIRLKQPRSNLLHKMSVPELCRNFRYFCCVLE